MRAIRFLALLPLAACSPAKEAETGARAVPTTGGGSTRGFAVTDFTGVALRGPDHVAIRVGGGFSVRAEGPGAELDRLDITRVGGTLKISRKQYKGIDWGSYQPVRITITMPRVTDAEIAGSGDMVIDRVAGDAFAGASAGSGDLSIGALTTGSATLKIAGSGDMRLKGKVDRLSIAIAGSGSVDAAGLKAADAKVSIAGSGTVKADVNGPATVDLMGAGDIDLGRNARCTTAQMGSGRVTCGR